MKNTLLNSVETDTLSTYPFLQDDTKELKQLMNKINTLFEKFDSKYIDYYTIFLSIVSSAKAPKSEIKIQNNDEIENIVNSLQSQIGNVTDLEFMKNYYETMQQLLYHAKQSYQKNLDVPSVIIQSFSSLQSLYKNGFLKYWYPRHYNKRILSWWHDKLDEILKENIIEKQWNWSAEIIEKICSATPSKTIENWKKEDPLCQERAWYNILLSFCGNRIKLLQLDKLIKVRKKVCYLCKKEFMEDSIPYPMVRRIGIENLDYCSDCLSRIIYYHNMGNNNLSKQDIIDYLNDLVNMIEIIPCQQFGENIGDLNSLDKETLERLLKLMKNKPSLQCIKKHFGSYLNALIQSGILEDGTRRTAYGTQTIAMDGHICLSLGEKTIDDYLFQNNIPHTKEPNYPEGKYRGDFLVNNYFIEYFGLVGNPDYDNKIKIKRQICEKYNIKLIDIYPKDLTDIKLLEKKLQLSINNVGDTNE